MTTRDKTDPQTGETLSSWLARWRGHQRVGREDFLMAMNRDQPGLAQAFLDEPDFPALPGWRAALAAWTQRSESDLDGLGVAPSPWHLTPSCRTSVCVACLGHDGPPGLQYTRTDWTDSWRTVCHSHGMPLIHAPAVGWGWGEVSSRTRRVYQGLMHRPDMYTDSYRTLWERLPPPVASGLINAEIDLMDAWREHYSQRDLSHLQPLTGSRVRVWHDLLILLSRSWGHVTNPSLASHVLPAEWVSRSQFLRTPPLSISQSAEDLSTFRRTGDPAVRRVIVLCAGDAILGLSQRRSSLAWERHRWGWSFVLQQMPPEAMNWLRQQSRQWPATYRGRAGEWFEQWTALQQRMPKPQNRNLSSTALSGSE